MELNDALMQITIDWMKSKHNTELNRTEIFAFGLEQTIHFMASFIAMGAIATDIKREVLPIRVDQLAGAIKKFTLVYYDEQRKEEGGK